MPWCRLEDSSATFPASVLCEPHRTRESSHPPDPRRDRQGPFRFPLGRTLRRAGSSIVFYLRILLAVTAVSAALTRAFELVRRYAGYCSKATPVPYLAELKGEDQCLSRR